MSVSWLLKIEINFVNLMRLGREWLTKCTIVDGISWIRVMIQCLPYRQMEQISRRVEVSKYLLSYFEIKYLPDRIISASDYEALFYYLYA